MRRLLVLLLVIASQAAFAEGRCPPGQYPVGDQNAGGCAPIPGAGQPAAASKPTGKWETRWGAIVEDQRPDPSRALATGVSSSQRSKRDAVRIATDSCKAQGGNKCEVTVAYYNQCVALVETAPINGRLPAGARSSVARAETVEIARAMALEGCQKGRSGAECRIIYSTCSMSEFREF